MKILQDLVVCIYALNIAQPCVLKMSPWYWEELVNCVLGFYLSFFFGNLFSWCFHGKFGADHVWKTVVKGCRSNHTRIKWFPPKRRLFFEAFSNRFKIICDCVLSRLDQCKPELANPVMQFRELHYASIWHRGSIVRQWFRTMTSQWRHSSTEGARLFYQNHSSPVWFASERSAFSQAKI